MEKNIIKRIIGNLFLMAFLCVAAAGCNMKRLVINSSYIMVEEAMSSFYEEPDTILAAQAAPANLKLIEGMARGAPDNEEIQLAAAQLLTMYTFGFLEDCCADEEAQEKSSARARGLYLRGREYGIRALQQHIDFRGLMTKDLATFQEGLKELDEDLVPHLFWTAFSWGSYINLNRADLSAVADLSKVTAMTQRVAELNEEFYYGGAHLFLMVFYGSMGKAVGGDPDKAKSEYEKAWQIADGKFLMTKYLFAKYYCQQTLDRELFEKLLGEVMEAPDDLLPAQSLSNALAKEKAARLLVKADDIF